MEKSCIILTAAIDPKGMTYTRRKNPKAREQDYITAIKNLSHQTDLPVVFVESSGYDISRVRRALEECFPGKFEIIQDEKIGDFPRHLGKGYGEQMIIKEAIKRSAIISKSAYVIKITGRYTIKNINEILSSLNNEKDIFVASEHVPGEKYTMSGFFVCKPAFLKSYFLPLHTMIDDSKQQPFEMALSVAIDMADSDGYKCVKFCVKPIVEGFSGTWNARFSAKSYLDVEMSYGKLLIIVRRCRKGFMRRWNALFHRS